MAKRQNFIVGSTNQVTETLNATQLNEAFNRYDILTADKLDGVFKAVSDYSNDSSNEIANAIQSITGSQPTGSTQRELAGALQQMRAEIETTSLTFKGYVATSAPSSSTYALVKGNIWINSATMPTSFPVAASSIKRWNGSSWVNYGSTYTPADFDFFRNINDNEGYYWFGGMWTVMSTDMSTSYFTLNQSTGKWEIKSNVNLPGAPTTTSATARDKSTKIATTEFVRNAGATYVANCLTEIPQDIKLELNNGTLTLKTGSKVYVPNGAGVFDEITVASDLSASAIANRTTMILYRNGSLQRMAVDYCYSGATAPTLGSSNAIWYDTANNVIKYTSDTGSTWITNNISLPLCIATETSAGFTSIDQVFNGFGYIGSSVFALPGVKGLIPNGRNTDGTLKSSSFAVNNVLVTTDASGATGALEYYVNGSAIFRVTIGTNTYKEEQNIIINSSGVQQMAVALDTAAYRTGGKVTSFTPKQVFHAVDYNDFIVADAQNVKLSGNQTISGTKTFSGTIVASNKITGSISGNCDGNAGTVTNGVYTTGNQTIGGTKTFSASPVVPTVATTDNSQKAASTAFIKSLLGNHYVTEFQAPTQDNNYTWYRKYADGWVEQGGTVTPTASAGHNFPVSLPVTMNGSNYNVQVTIINDTSNNNPTYASVGIRSKSTTYFDIYDTTDVTKDWVVFGMAA